MKLIVDLDGVLARFPPDLAAVLAKKTGRTLVVGPEDEWPATWNWFEDEYTLSEITSAFDSYSADPTAWERLAPYPYTESALTSLSNLNADVIYATARRGGVGCHTSTAKWLRQNGWKRDNLTLLTGVASKGQLAVSIGADLLVDDLPLHIVDTMGVSPRTACYLINRPYNRRDHKTVAALGAHIVPNITHVIEHLEHNYGKAQPF